MSSPAEELPVVVTVRPIPRGRLTSWEVSCSDADHGTFPMPIASKPAGLVIAGRHSDSEHGGRARLKVARGKRKAG